MPLIHNQGRKIGDKTIARKIMFPQGWDENGHPIKEGKNILMETLKPGEHKTVTPQQFDHLKAIFGDELVNLDDIKDMKARFAAAPAEKPREGYLSPEEVEAKVEARLKEEIAKREADKVDGAAEDAAGRQGLIERLDGMDRSELISLIEKEELNIEHKNYKNPGALKAAILSAMENKVAAA